MPSASGWVGGHSVLLAVVVADDTRWLAVVQILCVRLCADNTLDDQLN